MYEPLSVLLNFEFFRYIHDTENEQSRFTFFVEVYAFWCALMPNIA